MPSRLANCCRDGATALAATVLPSLFMANLGKNRKGKERKRKLDSRGGGEERVLQDRLRKATEADYRRRLALQVAAELKVPVAHVSPGMPCGACARLLNAPFEQQGRMMRENAARKLNSHRIHQQWLKIMRLTKVPRARRGCSCHTNPFHRCPWCCTAGAAPTADRSAVPEPRARCGPQGRDYPGDPVQLRLQRHDAHPRSL